MFYNESGETETHNFWNIHEQFNSIEMNKVDMISYDMNAKNIYISLIFSLQAYSKTCWFSTL